MHICAILNTDGGTLKTTDCGQFALTVERILTAHGHTADVLQIRGKDLDKTLEMVGARDDVDVIMAGGGDGTVSATAGACWRSGKALAVLPAGTMNLFARSLSIPLDLEQAVDSLARGHVEPVDIATVNGRPFVHQYAVGIHPRAVRLRDRMETGSRYGKIWASIRSFLAVIIRPPRIRVGVEIDAMPEREERLSNLSVSTNPFGVGHLPYADKLDQGVMGVYRTRPLNRASAFRLLADIATGRWSQNPEIKEATGREVRLNFAGIHRRTRRALVDGEVTKIQQNTLIQLHAGELNVVVPAAAEPISLFAESPLSA